MSLLISPAPASAWIGVCSSSSWYPCAPYFCLSVTRQFYYYYFFNQLLGTLGFTSSKHSTLFKFSLHLSSLTVFIVLSSPSSLSSSLSSSSSSSSLLPSCHSHVYYHHCHQVLSPCPSSSAASSSLLPSWS